MARTSLADDASESDPANKSGSHLQGCMCIHWVWYSFCLRTYHFIIFSYKIQLTTIFPIYHSPEPGYDIPVLSCAYCVD